MTEDEIREMEAGREMNELIAAKIMRWRRIEYDQLPPHHWPWLADSGHRWDVPSFSKDIAAAWQVVERMRNCGWWVRIKSAMDETLEVRGWAVEIGKWWNREGFGEWAPGAPLAICRAALLAVMAAEDSESERGT